MAKGCDVEELRGSTQETCVKETRRRISRALRSKITHVSGKPLLKTKVERVVRWCEGQDLKKGDKRERERGKARVRKKE